MKTLLATLVLFASFIAGAQNVAVLTHGAAGTKEFQLGCPAGWPYAWKDIGKSKTLPDGFDSTWIVMSKLDLDARFKDLEPEKEAWNKQREEAQSLAEEQAKAVKKSETDAIISDVEIGFKEWQLVDEKQKGEVLLKLLHLILDALRSLGSDLKQVEKPTSETKVPK